MHQVFFCIGGVHHQQIVVLLEQIQIRVVHGPAVLVGNDAVLRQIHVQRRHVAGQHVLQEFPAIRPFDQQTAHVGHIKQAAYLPGVEVLGNNAAGVLNGHFPSAEVHHFRAGGHMDVV